ncbi:hypothetical protein EXS66_01005 [Candidatus Saccharibacteria bacterium]|nr:hypothetical protein [Candidatus Saccharibacteria bacterium]
MLQAFPKGLRPKIVHHFLNPEKIVESLDIRAGNRVLEIGMPIGFFAPALLNKVDKGGAVYVAAPNQDAFGKLSHLEHRRNLQFRLLADILTGEAIANGEIDLVILTNLLSSSIKPDSFCLAIGQYLKPDSEIVLIDWDSRIENVGPSMDRRTTKEDALKLMHSCGMRFKRVLELPGYHYGIIFSFKKP